MSLTIIINRNNGLHVLYEKTNAEKKEILSAYFLYFFVLSKSASRFYKIESYQFTDKKR